MNNNIVTSNTPCTVWMQIIIIILLIIMFHGNRGGGGAGGGEEVHYNRCPFFACNARLSQERSVQNTDSICDMTPRPPHIDCHGSLVAFQA